MKWLRGGLATQLTTARLDRRTDATKDDVDQFTGSLHEALENWQATHGKPANEEDVVRKIGPLLLQTHSVPGMIYGTNQVENFREPPPDFIKGMKLQAEKSYQPVPTDDMIKRTYIRHLLQKTYPTTKASDG